MSTSTRSADLTVNDVFSQAQSGSITAIIQILNENLAAIGVRTRAVLEGNVLELLCEAAQAEELVETTLVPHIVHLLEGIAPPNIRSVNFYGRIIREQQLLWLDEIRRHPESLLWSQSMRLTRPNPLLLAWQRSRQSTAKPIAFPAMSTGLPQPKPSRLWYGLAGGTGIALSLIALGAFLSEWLQTPPAPLLQSKTTAPSSEQPPAAKASAPVQAPIGASRNALQSAKANATANTTAKASPAPASTTTANPLQPDSAADPFAEAVRVAEQASALGKVAKTSAQRLEQATLWRRASELMEQVQATDSRYDTAKDRVMAYRKNSDAAIDRTRSKP
jgi:hypothetical protein